MPTGVNMKDYRVIYKGEIYNNCLELRVDMIFPIVEEGQPQVEQPNVNRIMVLYLDESNRLHAIEDLAQEFQIIRKW